MYFQVSTAMLVRIGNLYTIDLFENCSVCKLNGTVVAKLRTLQTNANVVTSYEKFQTNLSFQLGIGKTFGRFYVRQVAVPTNYFNNFLDH